MTNERIDAMYRARVARSLPTAPVLALVDRAGHTEYQKARRIAVGADTLRRWRVEGCRMQIGMARDVAKRLGLTIGEIWFVEETS